MSFNERLASRLEELAQMLDLLGEDKFRVNANARAARAVEGAAVDLSTIAGERTKLMEIEGVGPKIADKIQEFARTGEIAEHQELAARIPPGLFALLGVQGLGPKTVRLLWTDRGVTDIAGLKRIIDDGSILTLPRMGEKAVAKLRAALDFASRDSGRVHLGVAHPVAARIVAFVRGLPDVKDAAFAGSLRRGRETIGDIDILACTRDGERIHEAFTGMAGVAGVISRGETRSSVRVALEVELGRWTGEGRSGDASDQATLQVDLRTVPPESWGAAHMYFTGSKEHNVRLRERALKQGLTLNEYGLYPEDHDPVPPHKRGVRARAGKTEAEVYGVLGLPWIPPELREDRGELSLEASPRLVEVGDVRCELHAHTTESDGALPLEELVRRARERGFHTIGVTDHSKSSAVAGGLDMKRLRAQRRSIDALRAKDPGVRVLHGSEVDILADGTLDFDDDVLEWLEVVVASPHASLSQDPATATARLVRAIENPWVNILGHPTGRLIQKRPGLEPVMQDLYAAAKANNVALEINAHWLRLDLRDTHVRAAVEAGCLIAIDCDVHQPEDFENLLYGVSTGRRGWLPPERCVNTWDAPRLAEWLRKGR